MNTATEIRVQAASLLGITVFATPAEIKTAVRRAAMLFHPDHGGRPAAFRLVTAAGDVMRGEDPRPFIQAIECLDALAPLGGAWANQASRTGELVDVAL